MINPATGEAFAEAPVGDAATAADAIAAARDCFDSRAWSGLSGVERSEVMTALRAAIERNRDAHTETMILESGAPAIQAGFMVQLALDYLEWAAEMARRDLSQSLPPNLTQLSPDFAVLGARTMVREPVGVVAAFAPFNSCFVLAVVKMASALAMGNTILLKPSPDTPLGVLELGAAALEAGLPEGAVAVVTGDAEVGRRLVQDPRVDMISFTGSDAVGAQIMAQAAPSLKRVLLELGGKSAMIVREDADLDLAASIGAQNVTFMAGQGCALLTRQLVHESLQDEYVDRLAANVGSLVVGDPLAPGVEIGPLINERQCARVQRMVDDATDDGARVVCGGARIADRAGFYFEPTVLAAVDNSWSIAQDEVFGPVASVIPFRDDADAVRIANHSRYGLSGGIVTSDPGKGWELAQQIRTGEVLINGGAGMMSPWAPFGGYKRSGIGREYGLEGLSEYSQVKSILFQAR